ncbi:MAG: CapA family protein [Spirochaetales bacterium]|uniref:CapA family protein n=1 Tax=Candidatus Thalassospirochaeta sargassi TaxID=3119039 RepID=A0AAJ1IA61_9SPIO|nr:CapA family protein [Spirochaetales bacterium]
MKRFFRLFTATLTALAAFAPVLNAEEVEKCASCAPPVKKELVLSFTGDMMAHIINYSMDDYSLIYRDIEKIMMNDSLTFCNVEFPVNPEIPQASYPVFNIHPEYVMAAIDAGVDVLSLANNHTGDQGTQGLKSTVKAVNSMVNRYRLEHNRRIYFSGAKQNPEIDFKPVTIYQNGWKIGYLSVSQFSNTVPEPGHMLLVDFRDTEESEQFVEWISTIVSEYDLFVLAYHGGREYYTTPVQKKTELFHNLSSAGVDIIWGHHPHVIQPVELYEHKNGNSLIMYSLGNFISGQGRIADPVLPEEEWSYTGDSAIIQADISFDGENPVFEDIRAIPIANIMTTNRDVVITPLEDLTHQAVPEPWMTYFLERYILMHDYFIRNIRLPG